MLKALELHGFKSFADRTRFEFPPGITAVVGPNGSGKSNVVDAIKWVLGEQSAKSLRGREMADVIFNGSGSRHPLNAAETTLIFDNSDRRLPIDTPEVEVTRRVYRSGEGEYLINRQPSRLRDIRDLFAGTGMATEAYSVIEQGKVDVLLQSSPRDRRVIFEEAAGISRFKAKKLESIRRLERVEQNLLRLADIVEEVDNQLRTVRKQAAKAQRYKELTDRLQELRTQVGLADWRHLGERLTALTSELVSLHDDQGAHQAQSELIETRILEAETDWNTVGETIRRCEIRHAENRERISALEATIEHERGRLHDLEEEFSRLRRQLAAMSQRAGNLEQSVQEADAALAAAEGQHHQLGESRTEGERALGELVARLTAQRGERESLRAAHVQTLRAVASLGSQRNAWESQLKVADEARIRARAKRDELQRAQENLRQQTEDLRKQQATLAGEITAHRQAVAEAERLRAATREAHEQMLTRRHELQQVLAAARERAAVLAELEQRLEGLGAGVKEVLVRARAAKDGPFRQVRGLVADAFQVSVSHAPLIEVALGDAAQYVVVKSSGPWLEFLAGQAPGFQGRVTFVPMSGAGAPSSELPDLASEAGVVARCDRLLEAKADFAPLLERLLGRTWLVETLTDARRLASQYSGRCTLVTREGHVLAADGTFSAGPRQATLGLISRRSELRDLQEQIRTREKDLADVEESLATLTARMAEEDQAAAAAADRQRRAWDARAGLELRENSLVGRAAQLEEQAGALETELQQIEAQWVAAEGALGTTGRELQLAEQEHAGHEARLSEMTREVAALEEEYTGRQRQATAQQVALAKSEERLGNLRTQRLQLERDQEERRRALVESQSQLLQAESRARQTRFAILQAQSAVAELYLHKESLARETVAEVSRREQLRMQRQSYTDEVHRLRTALRRLEERIHARQLDANEVRLQRDTLASRLRDDYAIELAELEHEPTAEEQRHRDEVDAEITELRRRITNFGAVNLESLTELTDLETRHQSLAAQYQDLLAAKNALEQIIHKINADSRRLFSATLETVRGHFQELFRKLFGGGQADILLEEGVDILDSGIEIVARPPGKEPRSISLLSGGEKTLTCAALLLSIFRSRPSPFCVLDEVDAALDEANIERFIGVLHEFLAWTQFVIVTHSKKTMTCANTLYGVTMQESGVSKRVSVRFEDVHENGEIRITPEPKSADGGSAAAGTDDSQAA